MPTQPSRQARKCKGCGKFFPPTTHHKLFCTKHCRRRHYTRHGCLQTEEQYRAISNNWPRYLNKLLRSRRTRKDLTKEDLLSILEAQNHRCALTGVPLTCTLRRGVRFPTNASIDRLNAAGPYTKDNVQLVCAAVNALRVDLTVEEFIGWCSKVADYALRK